MVILAIGVQYKDLAIGVQYSQIVIQGAPGVPIENTNTTSLWGGFFGARHIRIVKTRTALGRQQKRTLISSLL